MANGPTMPPNQQTQQPPPMADAIISLDALSLAQQLVRPSTQQGYNPFRSADLGADSNAPQINSFDSLAEALNLIVQKFESALNRGPLFNPYTGSNRQVIQQAFDALTPLRGIGNSDMFDLVKQVSDISRALSEQSNDRLNNNSFLHEKLANKATPEQARDALATLISEERTILEQIQAQIAHVPGTLTAEIAADLQSRFNALTATEQVALQPHYAKLLSDLKTEATNIETLVTQIEQRITFMENVPNVESLYNSHAQSLTQYEAFKAKFLAEEQDPENGFYFGRLQALGLTVDQIYTTGGELKTQALTEYQNALDAAEQQIAAFKAQNISVTECENRLKILRDQYNDRQTELVTNLKQYFKEAVDGYETVRVILAANIDTDNMTAGSEPFLTKYSVEYEAWKQRELVKPKGRFETKPGKPPPKEHELIQGFIETECCFNAYCKLLNTNASDWYRISPDGVPFDQGIRNITARKRSLDNLLGNDMVLRACEIQRDVPPGSLSGERIQLINFTNTANAKLQGTSDDDHLRRQDYFRKQGMELDKALNFLAKEKKGDESLQRFSKYNDRNKYLIQKVLCGPVGLSLLAGTKAISPIITIITAWSMLQTGFAITPLIATPLAVNIFLASVVLNKIGTSIDDVAHDWIRRLFIKFYVSFFNEKTANPISRLERRQAEADEIIMTFKGVYSCLVEDIYADPKYAKRKELALEELERMEMYYRKDKALKGVGENKDYMVGHCRLIACLKGWNHLSDEQKKAVRRDTLGGVEPIEGSNYECDLEKSLKVLDDPTSPEFDGGGNVSSLVTKDTLKQKPWMIPFFIADWGNLQTQADNFNLTDTILVAAAEQLREAYIQYTTIDFRLSPDSIQGFRANVMSFVKKFPFGKTEAPNDASQDSVGRNVAHLQNPLFYHLFWRANQKTA